jgi:RND family efflux transporter MFP subunit
VKLQQQEQIAIASDAQWSWSGFGGTQVLGVVLAVIISAIAVWVSTGFTRKSASQPVPPPGLTIEDGRLSLTADAPQWRVLKLSAATAASTRWTDSVPARVRIDETRAAKIGSPLSGRVATVFVEQGQYVREGDPLVSVSSPDIAALRAEKEKAAVEVAAAKSTLDRINDLVAARAVAAKDAVVALQQFKEAEVALKLAVAKLGALKVSAGVDNEFTILTPRAGTVVEKNVLRAQEVSPEANGPLLVVADLSSVWIVADLFEAEATDIQPGAPARVTSASLPGVIREGTVETVSSMVDPDRHTIPIRVRLDNPDWLLKPNMHAQVQFAVQPREGEAEVPASALVSDGEHQYVYIQESSGQFVRRAVIVGAVRDGKVSILSSNLHLGEMVVEEGAILLDNQITLAR